MPKTKKTKRAPSLRARYKQTGGSLAMAWVLMKKKKRSSRKQKKSQPSVPQFQITKGDLTDVQFIGPTGQKNWIGVKLMTFYVIIPGRTVVMFRRPVEPQFRLVTKDIVDHLVPLLGISPEAKLSYRGAEIPSEENLGSFNVDKAAFVLSTYWDPSHSGKLWTCLNQNCLDGPSNRRGFHRCVCVS